jgi:hypothetical protein
MSEAILPKLIKNEAPTWEIYEVSKFASEIKEIISSDFNQQKVSNFTDKFLIENIRAFDIKDISDSILQYCKSHAILFSENYLNKKTGERSTLSLFLDDWKMDGEEIELNFSVFWMKKWNN